jgi:DNA-binding response OmpR family regulator
MELRGSAILIVEDDTALRDLLQQLLQQEGYTVEGAPDCARGLARIEAGGVDLVLLDLLLPDGNGLDLCRHVRARPAERHLPIIILSVPMPGYTPQDCLAAGADDFIDKPFQLTDLLDRIRAQLERFPQ